MSRVSKSQRERAQWWANYGIETVILLLLIPLFVFIMVVRPWSMLFFGALASLVALQSWLTYRARRIEQAPLSEGDS